ncbi:hypothetical protein D3C80_1480590 [compost metagenome]
MLKHSCSESKGQRIQDDPARGMLCLKLFRYCQSDMLYQGIKKASRVHQSRVDGAVIRAFEIPEKVLWKIKMKHFQRARMNMQILDRHAPRADAGRSGARDELLLRSVRPTPDFG